MELKNETLQCFIRSIEAYFSKFNLGEVKVSTPYLATSDKFPSYDYTGIINLSGDYHGVIYLSATTALVNTILVNNGWEINGAHALDLVGEMSNILSGNARSELGDRFVISPPVSMVGRNVQVGFNLDESDRPYVIPFSYHDHKGMLVISFQLRSNPPNSNGQR